MHASSDAQGAIEHNRQPGALTQLSFQSRISHHVSSLVALIFLRSLPGYSCLLCSILPTPAVQPALCYLLETQAGAHLTPAAHQNHCKLWQQAAICRSIAGTACGHACHMSRDRSPLQSSANSTKQPFVLCTGDCIPRLSYYDAHTHLPVPPLQALQVSLPAAQELADVPDANAVGALRPAVLMLPPVSCRNMCMTDEPRLSKSKA